MIARLQHPSYSLEDRTTKPASSDEVDAFATLALATRSKRQRERTFWPRPSTFRRTDSSSALPLYAARTAPAFDIFQDAESPEDAFEAAVGNCVDYASGKLEFSGRNLKTIPSSIGDLANIVALDHFAATSSSMPNLRTDGRQGGVPVQLFLANNLLTPSSFPLSFFSLSNLTVLSLRGNPLSELPPSIGQLRALKELYLGGNGLRHLPAEIQQLSLDTFTLTPNPFLHPAALKAELHPASKRLLGPLQSHGKLPTLLESCYRRLLSKPTPSSKRVLADVTQWVHVLPVHLRSPLVASSSGTSAVFDPRGNVCSCRRAAKNFVQPLERRIEFAQTVAGCSFGSPGIPIEWRGCSQGCLASLIAPVVKALPSSGAGR